MLVAAPDADNTAPTGVRQHECEETATVVRTGCVRVPFEALPCNADYSW